MRRSPTRGQVPRWTAALALVLVAAGLVLAGPALASGPGGPPRLIFGGLLLASAVLGAAWWWARPRHRHEVVDRARWRRLQALSPAGFEELVAARLRARGYAVARAEQPDRGVDLVARRPGETVIVRCVHAPATTVGLAELRLLHAALHHFRANRACLATTAGLSRPAAEWAQVNAVEIWAGPGLASLAPALAGEPEPSAVAEASGHSSSRVQDRDDPKPGSTDRERRRTRRRAAGRGAHSA
jgi:hypothetical protein